MRGSDRVIIEDEDLAEAWIQMIPRLKSNGRGIGAGRMTQKESTPLISDVVAQISQLGGSNKPLEWGNLCRNREDSLGHLTYPHGGYEREERDPPPASPAAK